MFPLLHVMLRHPRATGFGHELCLNIHAPTLWWLITLQEVVWDNWIEPINWLLTFYDCFFFFFFLTKYSLTNPNTNFNDTCFTMIMYEGNNLIFELTYQDYWHLVSLDSSPVRLNTHCLVVMTLEKMKQCSSQYTSIPASSYNTYVHEQSRLGCRSQTLDSRTGSRTIKASPVTLKVED